MSEQGTGIQVSPEILREKYDEIAALDDQLALAQGGKNSGRTALANAYADANKVDIETWVNKIVADLENITLDEDGNPVEPETDEDGNPILPEVDEDRKVGIFRGLMKKLNEKYLEPTNKYLDAQVEENKKNAPKPETVTPDQLTEMTAKRKQLKSEYDALRNILTLFGESVPAIKEALEDIPSPKKLTGARGPRAMSKFQFSVDGKKLEASENSLSKVAEMVGFLPIETEPGKTKTARKQLTEALIALKFDPKEPDDSWSYPVNDHIVSGELFASATEADEDDDEDSSEDENEEETE